MSTIGALRDKSRGKKCGSHKPSKPGVHHKCGPQKPTDPKPPVNLPGHGNKPGVYTKKPRSK